MGGDVAVRAMGCNAIHPSHWPTAAEGKGAMRTYDQLTTDEQERARDKAINTLLEGILKGAIHFNDELNHDSLQAAIDGACEQANAMHTPWFASEYIMEAKFKGDGLALTETVGDTLRGMALCDAEDALYPGAAERIIRL